MPIILLQPKKYLCDSNELNNTNNEIKLNNFCLADLKKNLITTDMIILRNFPEKEMPLKDFPGLYYTKKLKMIMELLLIEKFIALKD